MNDEGWRDFVAVFCVQRGLLTIDSVVRLKESDFYMQAHRQFCCGGRPLEVQRMLEQAADETSSQ